MIEADIRALIQDILTDEGYGVVAAAERRGTHGACNKESSI